MSSSSSSSSSFSTVSLLSRHSNSISSLNNILSNGGRIHSIHATGFLPNVATARIRCGLGNERRMTKERLLSHGLSFSFRADLAYDIDNIINIQITTCSAAKSSSMFTPQIYKTLCIFYASGENFSEGLEVSQGIYHVHKNINIVTLEFTKEIIDQFQTHELGVHYEATILFRDIKKSRSDRKSEFNFYMNNVALFDKLPSENLLLLTKNYNKTLQSPLSPLLALSTQIKRQRTSSTSTSTSSSSSSSSSPPPILLPSSSSSSSSSFSLSSTTTPSLPSPSLLSSAFIRKISALEYIFFSSFFDNLNENMTYDECLKACDIQQVYDRYEIFGTQHSISIDFPSRYETDKKIREIYHNSIGNDKKFKKNVQIYYICVNGRNIHAKIMTSFDDVKKAHLYVYDYATHNNNLKLLNLEAFHDAKMRFVPIFAHMLSDIEITENKKKIETNGLNISTFRFNFTCESKYYTRLSLYPEAYQLTPKDASCFIPSSSLTSSSSSSSSSASNTISTSLLLLNQNNTNDVDVEIEKELDIDQRIAKRQREAEESNNFVDLS